MLTNQTMHHKPNFVVGLQGDAPGTYPNENRRLSVSYRAGQLDKAVLPASTISTDDFYDRLQRLWDQLLVFEDMGLIHTEFDKFKYAYQLAEAEIKERCRENAALRHQLTTMLRAD